MVNKSQEVMFNECPNDVKGWCKDLGHKCTSECLELWKKEKEYNKKHKPFIFR